MDKCIGKILILVVVINKIQVLAFASWRDNAHKIIRWLVIHKNIIIGFFLLFTDLVVVEVPAVGE